MNNRSKDFKRIDSKSLFEKCNNILYVNYKFEILQELLRRNKNNKHLLRVIRREKLKRIGWI